MYDTRTSLSYTNPSAHPYIFLLHIIIFIKLRLSRFLKSNKCYFDRVSAIRMACNIITIHSYTLWYYTSYTYGAYLKKKYNCLAPFRRVLPLFPFFHWLHNGFVDLYVRRLVCRFQVGVCPSRTSALHLSVHCKTVMKTKLIVDIILL